MNTRTLTVSPGPSSTTTPPPAELPAWASTPFRRWPITLAWATVAAVVAYFASDRFAQSLWLAEGTLIHTPLPISEDARGAYVSPSPQTLLSLVKSSRNLEEVVAEFDLPVTPRGLDRLLRVSRPHNADAVTLSLEWPDPEVGCAIVNRLMRMHAERTAELRKSKAGEAMVAIRAERDRAESRLNEARAVRAALPSDATPARLLAERELVGKEVSGLDADVKLLRVQIGQAEARRERATEQLAEARMSGEAAFAAGDADQPYRKRKEQLVDSLHAEEDKVAEFDAALKAQVAELERLARLAAKAAVSRTEYDKAAGEAQVLRVKKKNAESTAKRFRDELVDLPVHFAQKAKADAEGETAALRTRLAAAETTLAERRGRATSVADLIGREGESARRLAEAEDAVRATSLQLASLERLAGDDVNEFAVVQPAVPPPQPSSSNRKSLAAIAFAVIFLPGLAGLMAGGWLAGPRRRGEPFAGLPVLASGGRPGPGGAEAKQLALRLRDPLRLAGRVTLLTSAVDAEIEDVAVQLGRLFGLDHERVVLVDARTSPAASDALTRRLEGLSAAERLGRPHAEIVVPGSTPAPPTGVLRYLSERATALDDCVEPTPLASLSYVPAGGVFPSADMLASASMHDLIARLSERFERVLVLGPTLNEPLACEVLAGYADSVVVAFRAGSGTTTSEAAAVSAVRQAGPPWVGAVVRA